LIFKTIQKSFIYLYNFFCCFKKVLYICIVIKNN
jgi:hypothetical protein